MIKLTLKCGTRQDKGPRCQNIPLAGVNMRSCVSSYIQFLKGHLVAAASLETSSENPAVWKSCIRASVHADGTTSRPRCTLVETIDLSGIVRSEGDPHTVVKGVETTIVTATRGTSE